MNEREEIKLKQELKKKLESISFLGDKAKEFQLENPFVFGYGYCKGLIDVGEKIMKLYQQDKLTTANILPIITILRELTEKIGEETKHITK